MTTTPAKVAVIASGDESFREAVRESLHHSLWHLEDACGGADALTKLEAVAHASPHVALLLDSALPDLDAEEVASLAKRTLPSARVLMLDAFSGKRQEGDEELWQSLRHAADHAGRAVEVAPPPLPVVPCCGLPGMIGTSPAMERVYRLVRLVAARDTTVLITGETGTGKELIARALHALSPRADGPFVTINCSAIPDTLLESELFGYAKGAFTGAMQSKIGRIKAADKGTLFLDEIGELSPAMQAKLLRFLQEGEVQRLGESEVTRVDVRVVAATNVDLARSARERQGGFRQDLYYRLAVFPIELPELRLRNTDPLMLANYFLGKYGDGRQAFSAAAERAILAHDWPGNVRELQHAVERAVILADGETVLRPEHLGLEES